MLVAALVIFGLWLLGELLADSFFWSQYLFYIPAPAVAAALLALTLILLPLDWRKGLLVLVAAGLPLLVTVQVENKLLRPMPPLSRSPEPGTLRLVHWNLNGGYPDDRGPQVRLLENLNADLYLFSELHRNRMAKEFLANLELRDGPGSWTLQLIEPLLVVDRDAVWQEEVLVDTRWLRVTVASWKTSGTVLELMFVDGISDVTVSRNPQLESLVQLIEYQKPDLVIGDFNAPRRSRALRDLPEGYHHAYDVAGAGWSYTFPATDHTLPFLAIDQCIVGPRIRPLVYRLGPHYGTDHRLQIVDFEIIDSAQEP
jgi:endonuclease/exonuclease/phosphatase (EEP) superfamily protein YafD